MTTNRAAEAFTYRAIRSALTAAGFDASQQNMAGGVAALVVTVHNTPDRYAAIVIGNGEWTVWEDLDEPVFEGWLSVATEDHGDYVNVPEWGNYFTECSTVAEVVAAVRTAHAFLSESE